MPIRKTMTVPLTVALALTLPLAGCGSPKVDASSDAALDASMKRITASMDDAAKQEFATDVMIVAGPAMMKAVLSAGLSLAPAKVKPPSKAEIFKPLEGMTAAQIHAKAEAVRAEMAAGKAKGGA